MALRPKQRASPEQIRRSFKQHPTRAGGAVVLLMGLLVSSFAVWEVFYQNEYHIKAVLLAPTITLAGIYTVAVGRPIDSETGDVERWAKIGLWVALGAGFGIGILFLILLGVLSA